MGDYDTVAEYDTVCSFEESAEAYMEYKLKQYCMEHEGEYIAQVDHVCRVKKWKQIIEGAGNDRSGIENK